MKDGDIQVLNEYRERFVTEVEALAQGFSSGKKKVSEYCYSLYQFITDCDIQRKLKEQELSFKAKGEKALEKEYAQIYGIVMELLDRMVEILGEEELTRAEFTQLLETGFAKSKVALIPPSMDQVLVGDMERTRLKEIKALFFVGVNEGNIPKNTDSGGILTQMDREFFAGEGMELAPGTKGADEHPALLSLPESDQAKPVSLSFLLFFQRKRGACKPGVSDPQHPEALPGN